MPPKAYVLQDYRDDEAAIMEHTYQQAVKAIRVALCDGFEMAMNQYNWKTEIPD
jgi:peptidyl-tRNA hydrolase